MAQQPAPQNVGALETMLGRSLNPVVTAASGLLILACQLRNTTSHGDISGLNAYAVQAVKKFESTIANQGYSEQSVVIPARYVLCTFVDELVMSTPWGSESNWFSNGLLQTFHFEGFGGRESVHPAGQAGATAGGKSGSVGVDIRLPGAGLSR